MERSSDKELIESVYAVALEPDRYEELTHVWTEHLVQALELEHGETIDIEDDIQRGLRILDTMAGDDAATPRSYLQNVTDARFAVMAVNVSGEILEGNVSATTSYGSLEQARLSDLPFDVGSIEALEAAVSDAVSKPDLPVQMIRAVKTIHEGVSLVSIKVGQPIPGKAPYALVQTSDFVWPEHLLPMLEASFGLTGAESAIIRMMTEGHGLAGIAKARKSSLSTVRTQVRSIFEKTGAHSQTELVRMAIAFAALNDTLDAGQTTLVQKGANLAHNFEPAYPREEDRHLLSLPDGRVLDYSIIGNPKGKPVIFVHCAFFGDVWTAKAVKALTDSGLKIIAPARAFYQRSSPCPPKASPLEVYTQDVGHLIDHLKLDRFVLLARNIGSQFGFEIARRYPEQALAMLGISPALPFNNDEDAYANAESNQRFLASAAFYFPKLLELFVKAGQIYYKRVPPRKFIEKSFRSAVADYHLMDDPEILAAMTQGLAHSGDHGSKAFLHGYKDVRAHDYEMALASKFPIAVMVGAEDQSPRYKLAEALYKDGGLVRLIKLKGVAEFICQAEPEAVFKALNDLWSEYG